MMITKFRRNYIITSCLVFKVKRVPTNLTNLYFILGMFQTWFFSPFSNFNDDKIKLKVLK